MQTPVKLIVLCLIGMLIPNAAIASVPSTKLFTDVPESLPNAPYIYELVEKQILDGTGAHLFTPEGSLTREQFAKILSTAFQLKVKDNAYKLPFTDIHNEWSKPYIAIAYNEKLMDGVSADLFAPTEPITRQAAALIVWRWLQNSGVTNHSIANFQVSAEDTDSWAKEAVSMVLQNGLRTEGLSKEPYRSKEIMTRGDAAALIALSLKLAEAHNQHAAKDKNFQLDQPKRKELPPSGSGISLEQAKYYETSETARVTNTITWYRLDCETLHSLIFQTTGIERIEIRDAQGKYVSAHTSNQTSSSFIFDPKQTGFYYLEIKADPSKQAEFKAVNGASASKAIDYNIMDQVGASLQLPANQEVYFAFPMTNGSDYMIEAALKNGNLEKMTILNQKGDLLEDRQGINFIALKPTQTETYLLKVRSADQPATYKLKVQEKGVTKETAISIGSGIREVAITHTGVTWLNLTFPRDKNYDFKAENVTTYDLSLQGIDRLFGQTIFTSERDPSFNDKQVLRLIGTPGSMAKVTFLDGKSINAAMELNINGANVGRTLRPAVKFGSERTVLYKVRLEAGKSYRFWSEDAAPNDAPSSANDDTYSINDTERNKKIYVTDIVIMNQDRQEFAKSEDRPLIYKPEVTGDYYIDFKPGSNSKGYYLNVAVQ